MVFLCLILANTFIEENNALNKQHLIYVEFKRSQKIRQRGILIIQIIQNSHLIYKQNIHIDLIDKTEEKKLENKRVKK